MCNHLFALVIGYILDLLMGDPYWLPHPIRLIGNAIAGIEKRWNRPERPERNRCILGGCMVLLLVGAAMLLSFGILALAYLLHPLAGIFAEAVMTYQILATKCLKVESMKVYRKLLQNNLEEARYAVSMIVGRDTEQLDETGVTKAAIETVAENTSDGVIAPMFYLVIGGPVLGFAYKTINTMDSMVGYKNERYLLFGRAAAKLDDVVNFLPARLSALFMIGASFFLGIFSKEKVNGIKIYSGLRAWRIFKRDRRKHASPNSAQTEAACAGSLGIRLAGDAVYFGKVYHKPALGDDLRPVEPEDIRRANRLLYLTSFLFLILCAGILVVIILTQPEGRRMIAGGTFLQYYGTAF